MQQPQHEQPRPVQQGFASKGFASKVAQVADGILNTNPGMDEAQALHLARLTVERFPSMVKSAGRSDTDYARCPMCGDYMRSHTQAQGEACDAARKGEDESYGQSYPGHQASQHEARGGMDFVEGETMTGCPQCGKEMFSPETGHCHNCGYVDLTGKVGGGWSELKPTPRGIS